MTLSEVLAAIPERKSALSHEQTDNDAASVALTAALAKKADEDIQLADAKAAYVGILQQGLQAIADEIAGLQDPPPPAPDVIV